MHACTRGEQEHSGAHVGRTRKHAHVGTRARAARTAAHAALHAHARADMRACRRAPGRTTRSRGWRHTRRPAPTRRHKCGKTAAGCPASPSGRRQYRCRAYWRAGSAGTLTEGSLRWPARARRRCGRAAAAAAPPPAKGASCGPPLRAGVCVRLCECCGKVLGRRGANVIAANVIACERDRVRQQGCRIQQQLRVRSTRAVSTDHRSRKSR